MTSSRLASDGCLFCVIATGQRWAGSYAWVWTRKLWRVFSCKIRYRYWTLRGQIEDCHFVWTYALRPSSKNTFETISLHCWRFICLFSFGSYIETWLCTFWKQKDLVEVSRIFEALKTVCVMFSIEIFITALYFFLAFDWWLKVWKGLYYTDDCQWWLSFRASILDQKQNLFDKLYYYPYYIHVLLTYELPNCISAAWTAANECIHSLNRENLIYTWIV